MVLHEARDQVRKVLEDPGFRNNLLQRLEFGRRHGASTRGEPKDWTAAGLELVDLLDIDQAAMSDERNLYCYFRNAAIAELPQPAVISADDLQDSAVPHLGGMKEENSRELLDRFTAFVLLMIKEVASGPKLDFGDWTWTESDSERPSDGEDFDLFDLPNGFQLWVDFRTCPSSYVCPAGGDVGVVAFFTGTCTQSAIDNLTGNIGPLLTSFVRCLGRSAAATEIAPVVKSEGYKFQQTLNKLGTLLDPLGDERSAPAIEGFPPPLDWLLSEDVKRVLACAANCLLTESPFARRVKTAITYAQSAQKQADEDRAFALSLCVLAMESLLCNGDKSKCAQFKARIPTLLQSDRQLADKAKTAIGNVYNARSRFFHGDNPDVTQEQLAVTERLLSAALRAAIEWSIHDNADAPWIPQRDWIDTLRDAADRGHGVPGVTKELSEHVDKFQRVFGRDRLGDLGFDDD